MTSSVELQVISRILTSESSFEVDRLCSYDESYYAVFKDHIHYILDHKDKYGEVPDVFTFQAQFPSIVLVEVNEPLSFLEDELRKNKQHILLLETFNKLGDLGSADVTEAWQYLSKQVDRAAQLDASQPMNVVADADKRAEQIIEFNKQKRIPTGFPEIDKVMYGGLSTVEELLIIIARTNAGKAQPLWSNVLTPTGWKKMGDIKVGDIVVGKNNDNGRVVQIFPQGVKEYYKISFDDGTYTYCCNDHLWEVLTAKGRMRQTKEYESYKVLTTAEIRDNLSYERYSVDISSPIEFSTAFDELNELDGYLLGVLIGDGSLREDRVVLSNSNPEVWEKIKAIVPKYNCKVSDKSSLSLVGVTHGHKDNFIRNKLIEYGLMGRKSIEKFIPPQFLTAPIHVRKALLSGLVDTDGFIGKTPNGTPTWEYDTGSEQLAKDFAELARSLGIRVTVYCKKPSYYTNAGDSTRHEASGNIHIYCRSTFNPFTISRKSERWCYLKDRAKRHCKMIESIEYVGKTECQCILLDNVTHTYLTDDYIVTHNTWVLTKMMEAAQANGFPVLYYSPEMQASFIGARFDTWRGHFKNSELYLGKYSDEYKQYLKELIHNETGAFVVEDKDMSEGLTTVRGLEQLVKKHHIKLLIIDGLSYISEGYKTQTDTVRYKVICNDLFKLSKVHSCAVVVAMQANRETRESKDDKGEPFPTIYNAEGSDHPARIATQVFSMRQVFEKHILDIRLEKSRTAANTRPVFSYSWDPNTGTTEYIRDNDSDLDSSPAPTAYVSPSSISSTIVHKSDPVDDLDDYDDDDDDIEF